MAQIDEVRLPGVGIRYEFRSEDGRRIGVVAHRSGRKELYTQDPKDADATTTLLQVGPDDARTVAEMLGASRVSEQLADLQQRIEGLAIDWLPVRSDSPYAGKTIGDAQIRTRTGVSVVAAVRGDEAFPAPGPDFEMRSGDYLVVVGTPRGIEDLVELLHAG